MKISTKGIYGLKAIVDLASNSSNDAITLKSISKRQNISERYLEQIFCILKNNKIIKGKKGSKGGYMLERDMSQITVGDILRALEGDLCIIDLDKNNNDILEKCITDNVWEKINESIANIVDSITLEDLVNEYNKSISVDTNNLMYYI